MGFTFVMKVDMKGHETKFQGGKIMLIIPLKYFSKYFNVIFEIII